MCVSVNCDLRGCYEHTVSKHNKSTENKTTDKKDSFKLYDMPLPQVNVVNSETRR